jgi:hypothetical protein
MKKQVQAFMMIFTLLLFSGWTVNAQEVEYHFQEGFATNALPAGWAEEGEGVAWSSAASNVHNEFEGNYAAKLRPTDASLITKPVNGAGKLSFWLIVKDNSVNPVLEIDKSTDGMQTWTTIATDPQDNAEEAYQFLEVDVDDAGEEVYLRFHQTSTGGTSATGVFVLDDIALTKLPPAADDATLTGITVNGDALADFSLSVNDYSVELPYGTDEIVVEADANNANADVSITQVADPYGDEAARTATITVTSEDGTATQDYTVVFTVSEYHFKVGFTKTGESVAPLDGWSTGYTYTSTNVAIASGNHGEYPGDAAFKFVRGQEDKAGYLILKKYPHAGTLSFWLAVESADGSENLKVETKVGFGLATKVAEYTSQDLTDEWQLFTIEINETDSVEISFTPTMTSQGDVRIWMDDIALSGFPVVSARDILSNVNIDIYPNPATNYLYIDLKDADFSMMQLYSITGQKVLEKEVTAKQFNLNVEGLNTGVYFARFSGKSGIHSVKILKQ